MKKSLSMAVALSTLAAMIPLSFAESSSSSSVSSSSSSTSSSASSSWSLSVAVPITGPCADKKGLDLVNCVHNQSKMNNVKDETTRKDKTIVTHIVHCKNDTGRAAATCIKTMIKKETQKNVKSMSAGTSETNDSATKAVKACAGMRGSVLAKCLRGLKKN